MEDMGQTYIVLQAVAVCIHVLGAICIVCDSRRRKPNE